MNGKEERGGDSRGTVNSSSCDESSGSGPTTIDSAAILEVHSRHQREGRNKGGGVEGGRTSESI